MYKWVLWKHSKPQIKVSTFLSNRNSYKPRVLKTLNKKVFPAVVYLLEELTKTEPADLAAGEAKMEIGLEQQNVYLEAAYNSCWWLPKYSKKNSKISPLKLIPQTWKCLMWWSLCRQDTEKSWQSSIKYYSTSAKDDQQPLSFEDYSRGRQYFSVSGYTNSGTPDMI